MGDTAMNFSVAFDSGRSEDEDFCQLPPRQPVRSNLPAQPEEAG